MHPAFRPRNEAPARTAEEIAHAERSAAANAAMAERNARDAAVAAEAKRQREAQAAARKAAAAATPAPKPAPAPHPARRAVVVKRSADTPTPPEFTDDDLRVLGQLLNGAPHRTNPDA